MNKNSLYTNINLYIDFSIDIDLNMYIKIDIVLSSINLYQIITNLLII